MSDWSSDVCSSDLYLQLVIFGEDDAAALIVDDTLHDIVEIGRVLVEDRAAEAEFGNVMIVLVVSQPAFGYPRCISAGGPGAEQHHFHNRLDGVRAMGPEVVDQRSEDCRVGQECLSTCRYRWPQYKDQ